ncbi:MAG: carboxypeptidase-like regulatory domain-containing protein, partial [Planctomycetota bacterium]
MRGFVRLALLLACVVLIPTAVYAQASIVGTVKDTSGAVLPGVTVEASSPALIEKTRSAVTDGTGQFQISNLPPGAYSVTYTLAGFNTAKREGIELTGSFNATVNADLRVGALEETITVSGETPIVDVQNTTGEKVMTKDIIDAIPNGRGSYDLPLLIPGVIYGNGTSTQNVGGAQGNGTSSLSGLSVHGGRSSDQVYLQNGVQIASLAMSSFTSAMVINPVATQEMAVDTSAVSAEYPSGGIRINAITRDGGNTYRGTFFANYANSSMQGNNLTQSLKDAGLKTPDTIDRIYDINPGFGGPIMKDRLWFFESVRYQVSSSVAANAFYNLNANNPNAWTYVPDLTRPGINDYWQKDQQLRLSWQASTRNKFGINWHEENQCFCPSTITSTTAPEAANLKRYPLLNQIGIDWASPLTNRLLLEAGALVFQASSTVDPTSETNLKTMIPVTDQATGLAYRGMSGYRNRPSVPIQLRGAVSYISGAHSVKVGFNHTSGPT